MKKLMAAVFLLLVARVADAATLGETIDRTFDVRAGARVELSNVNGRIAIGSWDQPRVRVVAYKEVTGDKDDLKTFLGELKVTMTPRDGGLVVATQHPRNSDGIGSIFDWLTGDARSFEVRYEVTVPRNMNLEISNTNGRIELADVKGSLEVSTTNGRIRVLRCAGTLDASTTNGSIEADMREINGQPLRFETTNGRVEVTLPKTAAVNVDAATSNGSIKSDLPVLTNSTGRNSLRGHQRRRGSSTK